MLPTAEVRSLPAAVLRTLGGSPLADRLAAAQRFIYAPIIRRVRHSAFLGGHLALAQGTARRTDAARP